MKFCWSIGRRRSSQRRFEPQVLVGLGVVADLEWRGRRFAQHLQVGDAHLDLAGRQLAGLELGRNVPLAAMRDLPADADAPFIANRLRLGEHFLGRVVAEAKLGNAIPVAQIDKEHPAEVAMVRDPTRQKNFLVDMGSTQLAAGVRSSVVR